MDLKPIFGFIFLLIVVFLLAMYWFVPFNSGYFSITSSPSNFSLDNNSDMQFYSNMRFPESRISYRIEDCTLQKKEDIQRAFEFMEEKTILDFYSVPTNEEIYVTCSSKNVRNENFLVAGEGGPTKSIVAGKFVVIFEGQILLIKDSKCPEPLIAIHELLHVLGFNHSENRKNIMYPIISSTCNQELSSDMIDLINELYSIPSHSDLILKDISASLNRRYLDIEATIWNYGFKDAPSSILKIYGNGKEIKSIEVSSMEIGEGRSISLSNIFVSQLNLEELELEVEANFPELDKENNRVILEIKK